MPRMKALVKPGAEDTPPKQTLVEIADSIARVSGRMTEAKTEEEFNEALAEFNVLVADDLANKIDGYGYHERTEDGKVKALRRVIKVARAGIKAITKAKQRKRDCLLYVMARTNTTMIKGHVTCINLLPGKVSLDVYNEDLIPIRYFERRYVYVLDTDSLRRDLENGVPVNGARLKTGDDYLQIK